MPVDELKIDRSFVWRMGHSSQSSAIVGNMINLAKASEMSVVAEGVETELQWGSLVEKGCDYFQGFYLQQPLAADKATEILVQQGLQSRPAP